MQMDVAVDSHNLPPAILGFSTSNNINRIRYSFFFDTNLKCNITNIPPLTTEMNIGNRNW